jgi:hypothetical protein
MDVLNANDVSTEKLTSSYPPHDYIVLDPHLLHSLVLW